MFKQFIRFSFFVLIFLGQLFFPSKSYGTTYDWNGAINTDWNVPANWTIDGTIFLSSVVPGPSDIVQIGVGTSGVGFFYQPTISSTETESVSQVVIGNQLGFNLTLSLYTLLGINMNNVDLTVNGSLTVSGAITVQTNFAYTNTNCISMIGGSGTVNAASMTVGVAGQTSAINTGYIGGFYIAMTQATGTINLTNNLSINAISNTGGTPLIGPAAVFFQSGTLNCTNVVATSVTGASTYFFLEVGSLFASSPPNSTAVINVSGTTPFSGSGPSQEYFDFTSATNASTISTTVNFNGTNQPISTTLAYYGATGYTGQYYNLIASNAGTKTTGAGTLTVNGNMTTTGVPLVDMTANNTVTAVTGTLSNAIGATIKQGTGSITTGPFTNAGTFTGSGALNVFGAFNNSGTATFGSGAVTFSNNYTNTGPVTVGTGTLFYNGTGQMLTDNSTNGTNFNNVTFNGTGKATMVAGTGNFTVAPTGLLTMANNAGLVAGSLTAGGAGYLTLLSNGSGSATVGRILGTSTITGNVNVQRFLTGTASTYRGYRVLSAPVNSVSPVSAATNYINLYYLNKSTTLNGTTYNGPFTAGPGGAANGFSATNANPTIYIYDETLPISNTSFISGKNVGIKAVPTSSTVTAVATTSSSTGSATVPATPQIPAGNGYLFYFLGSNTRTSGAATVPINSATVTATGFLNQQNVTVNLWYTGSGGASHLSLTSSLPAGSYKGYNMVGNPYASTIDLKQVYTDNSANNIGQVFYELDDVSPNNNYVGYNGSSGATSGTPASAVSEFVASGQGFLVTASSPTASTLTFTEAEKPITVTNPSPLILTEKRQRGDITEVAISNNGETRAIPGTSAAGALTGLHLHMAKDSATFDECGIYFRNDWSDNFDAADGLDLDGIAPSVYLSSYTADHIRTCINSMSDYVKGKKIKLYVKGVTDGNYSLKLADIANIDTAIFNIYLIDHLNNDSLDLVRYKTYAFTIKNADTTSYGANRLELHIEQKHLAAYELIAFTGQPGSNAITLNWKTYNEGTYTGFALQKKEAGSNNYQTLYTLQSDGSGAYNYADHNPVTGNNTYRLQQNNIDSLISYSNPITISYGTAAGGLMSVYPNPARESITVKFNAAVNGQAADCIASIYDSSGSLLMRKAVSNTGFSQDVSALKPGVYVIHIQMNGSSMGSSKFIKYQ